MSTSKTFSEQKPSYGRRLIPPLIDQLARERPNDPFAILASSSKPDDGCRVVSYAQFANAINCCAWWLEAQVGRSNEFNTLAFLGGSSLISCVVMLAAIKTGHQLLLSSPRNTIEAHLNLLETTQCCIVISAVSVPPVVDSLRRQKSLQLIVLPDLCPWLECEEVARYPYTKTFEEARYEPFVVVHTSGSTGLPRAITVTHGAVATSDAFNEIALDATRRQTVFEAVRHKRCLVSVPAFHIAGIDFIVAKAYYYGVIPVLPPVGLPMNAQLVDAMHQIGIVEVSVLAPSVLQEIVQSPSLLQNLRRLDAVVYGGGPLPREVGEVVRSATNLFGFMGSTEMFSVVTDLISQENWEYLALNEMMGSVFRPHAEGLWELCLVRKQELDLYQGVFANFPALDEYHTNDLYSKHPDISGLWHYSGRADDIITLTNGEKLNPVGMEDIIRKHPDVEAALVVGQARFRTALLVEAKHPPVTAFQRTKLRQSLWQFMTEANRQCPAHGKLSRDLILFAHDAKPFLRSQKGSVQRRLTLALYEKKLNELYEQPVPLCWEESAMRQDGSVRQWLHLLINRVTDWDVDVTSDFFSLGMDSLQVLQLVQAINAFLARDCGAEKISAKTIYSFPTLEQITVEVERIMTFRIPGEADRVSSQHDGIEKMERLFSKTVKDLPDYRRCVPRAPSTASRCIMLTGSTGYIGSHVLRVLLASPRISLIYCLNRARSAKGGQRAGQTAKVSCTEGSLDRVRFLTCDVAKEKFGLESKLYEEMLTNVTHIVHNAWVVDFNLALDSFGEDQVVGVLQLIRFSAGSKFGARVHFLSSIAAVMNWESADSKLIPEQVIKDWAAADRSGYGQSKHVAERLLDTAAITAGIPSVVWRVGQVAGPIGQVEGSWNKREWLPSLIASSLLLGKIPSSLGPNDQINWVPVDSLSQIILELLEEPDPTLQEIDTGLSPVNDTSNAIPFPTGSSTVYNLINPRTTTWQAVLPTIQAYYSNNPLEIIDLRQWVDALRTSAFEMETMDELSSNPAAKLLDFFESLADNRDQTRPGPRFDTSQAEGASKTLRELGCVNGEWMVGWLKQWNFEGDE